MHSSNWFPSLNVHLRTGFGYLLYFNSTILLVQQFALPKVTLWQEILFTSA